MGPPGSSPPGVDITPPTIEITKPKPLSTTYDKLEFAAEAIDNVAIREVVFTLDGSPILNGNYLVDNAYPYEITIDTVSISSGWHFVAARAYDIAGNVTGSPVVPVNIAFSADLMDTVRLSYNNGVPSRAWTLPDTFEIDKIWTRFSTPREATLTGLTFFAGAKISDSSRVVFELRTGEGLPGDTILSRTIPDSTLSEIPDYIHIDLTLDEIRVKNDFFIAIGFDADSTDTLLIYSDDGSPPWGRSGTHDIDGWHSVSEKYGVECNFIIECNLYYEPVVLDQAAGLR